jgi:hypothetical protein
VGIGTSLVLDEFAMILHRQDVYWSGEGQLSVEAVSMVAACLALVCTLKGKTATGRPTGELTGAGGAPHGSCARRRPGGWVLR